MKGKLLILIICLIVFLPLFFFPESEFQGTDSQAEEAIVEGSPDYKPWFQPIFEPSSGEVESLLFALQAALGAGFIGYVIGIYKGRKGNENKV